MFHTNNKFAESVDASGLSLGVAPAARASLDGAEYRKSRPTPEMVKERKTIIANKTIIIVVKQVIVT